MAESLNSILGQTLTDFELLAVNDHSTDDSTAIVAAYARMDRRIRLLQNPTSGLVAALNHGLSTSRAELVARMDADDRMHPERLALQFEHLRCHDEIAVLGTRVEPISETPISAGLKEYLRWQNQCVTSKQVADDIYLEAPFAHPSVMFRKRLVRSAGGYREGTFPEDYELWLRLHRLGARMEKLPRVLLQWRDWPMRTSRVDPRCSRDAFDRLRAEFLADDPRLHIGGRELVIWGAGRKTRRRADLLIERSYRPSAWVDIDPRKIGNRIAGVPVVAPQWLRRDPKPLVLCYVASHGARELIDGELHRYGYKKGKDYLQVG